MIEPAAYVITSDVLQLDGQMTPTLSFTTQEPHPYSGNLTHTPLYTEAQLIEKHKRILWDVCQAYGKSGECIFTVFKYKVAHP